MATDHFGRDQQDTHARVAKRFASGWRAASNVLHTGAQECSLRGFTLPANQLEKLSASVESEVPFWVVNPKVATSPQCAHNKDSNRFFSLIFGCQLRLISLLESVFNCAHNPKVVDSKSSCDHRSGNRSREHSEVCSPWDCLKGIPPNGKRPHRPSFCDFRWSQTAAQISVCYSTSPFKRHNEPADRDQSRCVHVASPNRNSNRTSIFQASGLQVRFGIQARHRTRSPFSFKKGTAAVALGEFGNECGVVAVNLILRMLTEPRFPA
jgi:hypothetical protein